jgi:Ca2+-binding EF-hand superfamily protein
MHSPAHRRRFVQEPAMNALARLAVVAIVSLSAGLPVAAEPQAPGPRGGVADLMEFDGNGDRQLTRAELSAGQDKRFAAIDTNKDGFASAEELKVYAEARRSEAEAARLARLDANGDGKLSEEEKAAAPSAPGKGRRGGGERDPDPARMLGRIDTDGDGKVSKTEFSVPADRLFAAMDNNADGVVDASEFQAMRGRRKG